ncbi:MAG: tetratricopeptide repeat protein [Planctomycetota bacterium]
MAIGVFASHGCSSTGTAANSSIGDPATARSRYLQADARLFDNPYDIDAALDRAEALADLGRLRPALDDAALALTISPRATRARQVYDRLEARIAVEGIRPRVSRPGAEPAQTEPEQVELESAPDPEPAAGVSVFEDAMSRVRVAIGESLYSEALTGLDAALVARPGEPSAVGLRGWTLTRLGRHGEAAQVLEGLDPRSPRVSLAYAYALLNTGKPGQALDELDRLIERDGPDAVRLMYRGVAKVSLGEPSAVSDLEASLRLAPDEWEQSGYVRGLLGDAFAQAEPLSSPGVEPDLEHRDEPAG